MKERTGPIARPGYPFILGGVLIILLGLWAWQFLVYLGVVLTAFFAYFFRDPERVAPTGADQVVSPADGRIISVETVREETFLKKPVKKLSIFMNVFDVHVNRAPVAAQVQGLAYQQGRYLAANRPEAPDQNERLAIHLKTPAGGDLVMVQIAGLLARRIISYIQEGDALAQGERLGLICFGSRVDLYLPDAFRAEVKVGQKVKAGMSVLGRMT